MRDWALIIHPYPDMLELLVGAVKSVLGATDCVLAENIAGAQAELGKRSVGDCRLVVCSLTAPKTADQVPSLDGRELHGVDFALDLRQRAGNQPPVIFLGAFSDPERAARIGEVANSRCLGMTDLFRQLPRDIRDMVLGWNNPTLHHIDVDIVLSAGQKCGWSMRGTAGNPIEDHEQMDITEQEILDLANLCIPAAHGDESFLRTVGGQVYRMLMDPVRSALERKLEDSVKPLGGMEFARIRFNVDEKTHCILLETLAKPDKASKPQFWMMSTPIFRKLTSSGTRYPLFQNPATRHDPVDCLLIQGRCDEFAVAGAFNQSFHGIPSARAEIDWLEDYLQDNREEFGIGTIEVLRHDQSPDNFPGAIEAALGRRQFELVHYAGHSLVDPHGEAWLVLGDGDEEQLALSVFSRWARELQFVFLSSCESANSQFIMQLVRREVPAVIGYGWPVRDEVALEFAQTFYKKLLGSGRERRLLEYSFMAGKQALHRKWPNNAHWAAPLLFMQVFEPRDLRAPALL